MKTRAACIVENVAWTIIFSAFAVEVVYVLIKWMEPK